MVLLLVQVLASIQWLGTLSQQLALGNIEPERRTSGRHELVVPVPALLLIDQVCCMRIC